MAELNFPSNPTVGQIHTVGLKSWEWTGVAWRVLRTQAAGKSAYESAVELGFVGTEAQWIASLKGVKGDTGDQGPQGETGQRGVQGDPGDRGADGTNGTDGVDGEGVPAGGAQGQVLTKASGANYDTIWVTPDYLSDYTVPLGGNQGQFLGKTSATDGDFAWLDLPAGSEGSPELPNGGNQGQVLTKASATSGDVIWADQTGGNGVPDGGTTGQVLTKNSNMNGDATWQDASGGGSAEYPDMTGHAGDVLAVNSTQDGVEWIVMETLQGPKGDKGDKGDTGAQGPAGTNGTNGTNGNGVPVGGYTGQLLSKVNGEDFNTAWIDPPEGGGGSDTNPTVHYPSWGLTSATITQSFDSMVLPSNFTWNNNTPGSIVDDPDAGPSTTKALRFGNSDNLGNFADYWLEFVVIATEENKTLTVRFKSQGEPGYDGFRLLIDGVEKYNYLNHTDVWLERVENLTVGTHTVRFRYTSDRAYQSGFQNTHFSTISYPDMVAANAYQHGDTADHNGKTWLCLTPGTNDEPGTSDAWVEIFDPNSSMIDPANDNKSYLRKNGSWEIANLTSLTDTSILSPTHGQVLTFDSISNLWIAKDSSGTGSSKPWYWSPPTSSIFTTTWGNTAPTLTDDNEVGLCIDLGTPATGDVQIGKGFELPTTGNCQVTIHHNTTTLMSNYAGFGLRFFNSSNNRLINIQNEFNASLNVTFTRTAAPSTYSATIASNTASTYWEWLRLSIIGTTIYGYVSRDGKNWVTLGSEQQATWLTARPTHVGIGGFYNRTTNNILASIDYFNLATL